MVEEITGRSPDHTTGMLVGLGFSIFIIGGLGAGLNAFTVADAGDTPTVAGMLGTSAVFVLLGLALGGIGAKLGFLDSEISDQTLSELTYDEEDLLAEYGLKSPFYDEERAREMASLGFALATFQFLFGTLWRSFTYFVLPNNLPESGIRAATAVLMYLQQSGRTSQADLTSGLVKSGLAEAETRAGLLFLRQRGYVVGNSDGYVLTEKAMKILDPAAV
jgi:hypothetical protein